MDTSSPDELDAREHLGKSIVFKEGHLVETLTKK